MIHAVSSQSPYLIFVYLPITKLFCPSLPQSLFLNLIMMLRDFELKSLFSLAAVNISRCHFRGYLRPPSGLPVGIRLTFFPSPFA
jgi:hypothetical protein